MRGEKQWQSTQRHGVNGQATWELGLGQQGKVTRQWSMVSVFNGGRELGRPEAAMPGRWICSSADSLELRQRDGRDVSSVRDLRQSVCGCFAGRNRNKVMMVIMMMMAVR